MLAVVIWAAYAETSVSGWPLGPIHGKSVTASENNLGGTKRGAQLYEEAKEIISIRGENGFPALGALGYSLRKVLQ